MLHSECDNEPAKDKEEEVEVAGSAVSTQAVWVSPCARGPEDGLHGLPTVPTATVNFHWPTEMTTRGLRQQAQEGMPNSYLCQSP